MASQLPITATNRSMRDRQELVLTVGQGQGDLTGNDDKIIQAGIEYLHRIGGGTLQIGPGVYNLNNFIYLRPNITLRGSGEKTILRKSAGVVTKLLRQSDWFEYGVQVEDPAGFVRGGGIMLRSKKADNPAWWVFDVLRATVTDIRGDIIFFDQRTEKNFNLAMDSNAATIFSILYAENVHDVHIEDIVLDGNRGQNEPISGNYAGAVFLQYCNRWSFKNVIAKDYNGDGFSFQVCDDIHFDNCKALNNAQLGFHPGSGSQRMVLRNCDTIGNDQGVFFCWSVNDGLVENCTVAENKKYGINIGHRDTDNIIRNSTIERNVEVGILFRDESDEFLNGHRNLIDKCVVADNGSEKSGIGIDICGIVHDLTIRNTHFENTNGKSPQKGIRIGKDAKQITLEGNRFVQCVVDVEDLRAK